MQNDYPIQGCRIIEPTIARAQELVPPEFLSAWRRFQAFEGKSIEKLPVIGTEMQAGLPLRIASQRGIHSPNYRELESRGNGCRKYAVSVHSEGHGRYADKELVYRGDGTWVLEYKAHVTAEGKRSTDSSTTNLMNCLEDGIPVGVLLKRGRSGYLVLGLAFVEQYNELTDSFTLHGPIRSDTEDSHQFLALQPDELSELEKEQFAALSREDDNDERLRVFAERVQREHQSTFRRNLLRAYEEACAITDTAVPAVLQAAHIDPYRGRRTQVVTNGILMRADLHLLYDAHLMSVEPGSYKIHLNERLAGTQYEVLAGHPIRLPNESDNAPDDGRLEFHFKQILCEGNEL